MLLSARRTAAREMLPRSPGAQRWRFTHYGRFKLEDAATYMRKAAQAGAESSAPPGCISSTILQISNVQPGRASRTKPK